MIIKDVSRKTINKILILSIAIVAVFLSYYFVSKNNNKLSQTTNEANTALSSSGSKIVFSRLGEIITMDSSGNNQIVLVGNNGCSAMTATSNDWSPTSSNWSPAWSPDSSKIAYISAKIIKNTEWQPIPHEIWIMDSDGNNKKKIFEDLKDKKDLLWSPDGLKISFKASIKEITQPEMYDLPYELWEINVDGSGLKQLTKVE